MRENRTMVRDMIHMTIMFGGGLFFYVFFYFCLYEQQGDKDEETNRNNLVQKLFPNGKRKIVALTVSFMAAGLLAKLFFLYGYLPTKVLKYLLLIGGLIPIAWEDWREKTIPNRWLAYLLCIRVVVFGIEVFVYSQMVVDNLLFTVIGGVVSGLVMFAGYVISRHQIGPGDVKLLAVMGMYLGAGLNYFVIIAALILAAIYGGVKILLKCSGMKDEIAFAPFIAAGAVLILALGF